MKKIGKPGTGNGEFNLPTELRLYGDNLAVVDAMNFRVQVLDKNGEFQYSIGKIGDVVGAMFRPKAVGFDSEGHLYVVDGTWSVVQVFNREGQLLYYFGQLGTAPGAFQLPAGLRIDGQDRIYVVDSFNRRVQVFHYYGAGAITGGRSETRAVDRRVGRSRMRANDACAKPAGRSVRHTGHAQHERDERFFGDRAGKSRLHLLSRTAQWSRRSDTAVEPDALRSDVYALHQYDL